MSRSPPNPAGWLWALGAAILVTSARWREIALHGGEIPYLDQWRIEAGQILLPWLDGKLSLGDFFIPHHEHVPAWTRLLAWIEAAAFGCWDAQLQATINAGLMGAFTGALAAWLRRSLALGPALILTLLAVALWSLPHSWENIVWGLQAHVPLALLFVLAHLHLSFARSPGTASWWIGQAAGLAALFTLGSMWAASFAVVLVLLWTSDFNWRRLAAAGCLTLAGVALLLTARAQQPVTGAYALAAPNLPQFIAALLLQLGWPSAWPGVALLINLPALLLSLRLRGQARSAPLDRTILALALWAAAQAVAFAYGRGSYVGFVSRYGDLLALGVLANGVALWRLMHQGRRWTKGLFIAVAAVWIWATVAGLRFINIQGHTLYFHEHSTQWAQERRAAVREYLLTHDPGALAGPEVRGVLFPEPAEVARVLDRPSLAALLPATVAADPAQARGKFASDAAHGLREFSQEFAWCGGLLLLAGVLLAWRAGQAAEAQVPLPPSAPWSGAAVFAGLALGSGALLFLWPQPFEYRTERRWARFLNPAGTVPDMSFQILTGSSYPNDRLVGAAALWPEDFRNTFFGTHIDGPAFTGVVQSSPFKLDAPWYIVPYAGYPVSAGSSLRLRVEDATGKNIEEIQCPGPNPGPGQTDIGFWAVDVRAQVGRTGRLVIEDQRAEAEGWVAVAPPQPSGNGPRAAAALRRGWAAEGTLSGLKALQIVCAVTVLLAAGTALAWRLAVRRPAG